MSRTITTQIPPATALAKMSHRAGGDRRKGDERAIMPDNYGLPADVAAPSFSDDQLMRASP
jgi:hypothetical protein